MALRGAGDPAYTLKVLGNDYKTRDGSAIKDYIHVMDLADGHLRALEYLQDSGDTTAINLGTGTGTSVLEIRDSVARITGRSFKSEIAPRRPGDPPSLVAVPEKAKVILGWKPTQSHVDQIIRDAWSWHLSETKRNLSADPNKVERV